MSKARLRGSAIETLAFSRSQERGARGDQTRHRRSYAYEIERVLVDGDMAAAFVTMSGTHEGGLPPGAPATHKPFAVKHVHLFPFADDGRALEHWAVRDDLGLAMQAGLLPPLRPDSS